MKRTLAIILLTAFGAGPSLEWLCERACDAGQPVAPADHCHGPGESAAQVIVTGHDCGDHASPVALVSKRVQPESQSFVLSRVASRRILQWRSPGPGVVDSAFSDSGPPLASLLVPLRI